VLAPADPQAVLQVQARAAQRVLASEREFRLLRAGSGSDLPVGSRRESQPVPVFPLRADLEFHSES
jgi:hypothetical protein